MSASAKTPLAGTASTPPTLRASAERVASALGASVGAWACYLALAERIGQTPRLLAMSGPAKDLPTWRALDGAALLRRAFSSRAPLIVRAGEWPALALPIMAEDQPIGVAVLLYQHEEAINIDCAQAAARLAASALDANRQVALLQFQAEEIEERTRL